VTDAGRLPDAVSIILPAMSDRYSGRRSMPKLSAACLFARDMSGSHLLLFLIAGLGCDPQKNAFHTHIRMHLFNVRNQRLRSRLCSYRAQEKYPLQQQRPLLWAAYADVKDVKINYC
jgi:hypothetical protein